MTDKDLVGRFLRDRSEKAFNDIYNSKTPRLYQIALRLTGHHVEEAQDLIQEMWVIAIRKIDLFRWESELRTWLTGILINIAREKRKKNERETQMRTSLTEVDKVADEYTFTTEDLEAAIAKLPAGYKQAIILHDIEGYRHEEIASILDVSIGTSKSQLYYARKALRNYLKDSK